MGIPEEIWDPFPKAAMESIDAWANMQSWHWDSGAWDIRDLRNMLAVESSEPSIMPYLQYRVAGDFDGDGLLDFAAAVDNHLIALMRRGDTFRVYRIDGPVGTLAVDQRGNLVANESGRATIHTPGDVIVSSKVESDGILFLWNGRGFNGYYTETYHIQSEGR